MKNRKDHEAELEGGVKLLAVLVGQSNGGADIENTKSQRGKKSKLGKKQKSQEVSENVRDALTSGLRKVDHSLQEEEMSDGPSPSGQGEEILREHADPGNGTEEDDQAVGLLEEGKRVRKAGSKKLSKEKLERLNEKYRKRGVVYVSRIPPHMKPLKLRHMLEPFGEVLRIYLAPEDSAIRARRKRAGGDSGKNYTEG